MARRQHINNTPHSNKTQHTKLHKKIKDTLHTMNTITTVTKAITTTIK
jgi:hypothetical protein